MNETTRCPGCEADLVLPILPAGQTVQCPRCQHVFEPALRRARAVAPAPIARRRPADDYPEPLDETPEPLRYRPLVGEWKAIAAMIALALCVLSYGLQVYTTYEKYHLVKLDERVFGNPKQFAGMNVFFLEKEAAEVDRQRQYVDELSTMAAAVHMLTFWPTVVLFLIWFYQAAANLRILLAGGLVFMPVKTVFAFFIPFVNVIMPYQVMQEIWRASDPGAVKDMRSWQHVPGGWLVLAWWLALLAATALRLGVSLSLVNEFDFPEEPLFLIGVINVAMMAAGVMLILIIQQIRQRQHARHAKIYDEVS